MGSRWGWGLALALLVALTAWPPGAALGEEPQVTLEAHAPETVVQEANR